MWRMGKGFGFEIKTRDEGSLARVGTISTPHGEIQTPAFIPVGTQATHITSIYNQVRTFLMKQVVWQSL